MSPLGCVVFLVCVYVVRVSSESGYGRSLCDVPGEEAILAADEFRQVVTESIKTQFLQTLQMTEPPQVEERPVIPEILLKKYEEGNDDDSYTTWPLVSEDDDYVSTRQVAIFPDNTSTTVCPESNETYINSCLRFRNIEEVTSESVKSAELWLHRGNSSLNCSCDVAEITPDPEAREGFRRNLLDSLNSTNWAAVDIGDIVRAWSHNEGSFLTLEVSCASCDENLQSPVSTENDLKPFMLVSLHTRRNVTASRSKRTFTCGVGERSCCVRKFKISFNDIGWDHWILQPPSYNANYCTGSCVDAVGLTRYHYTTVIRNYIQRKGNSTVTLCCIPYKLKGLSMIYRTVQGHLSKVTLENMVVDSCDCA